MTKGESQQPRVSPVGRAQYEILHQPRHPEYCEARLSLFTSAIVAQRNTVEFLNGAVGVDIEPLVAQFAEWENSHKARPAETKTYTIAYFHGLAEGAVTAQDERRGILAMVDREKSLMGQSQTTHRRRMILLQEALKNHLSEKQASTASGVIIGSTLVIQKLPEEFLNIFIEGVVPKPEQKAFRAYLAGELFADIHDNLILPGHRVVRELDDAIYHQPRFAAIDPVIQEGIQKGKEEMQHILEELPFMPPPLAPLYVSSDRLKDISPTFLQYFSPLGWNSTLQERVTAPYASRMREITLPLFASLS